MIEGFSPTVGGRVTGTIFEGQIAAAQDVRLWMTAEALMMAMPEDRTKSWRFSDIRLVPDQAAEKGVMLAHADDALARLMLADEAAIAALLPACRNLRKRPRSGKGKLVFGWAAAAITSVVLIIFVLVPLMADQLARFLPPEGEKALGDATFEQIRSALDETGFAPLAICATPKGQAALDRMVARVAANADLPYPIEVHVLDHRLINAFALPGGRIVFFRGLIEAAESPEEVAAVFAHELGHVAHRDPARGALRSAGSIGVLGLLFGDFAGGTVVLFLANQLINATYSQKAEAAADAYAHERMTAAGLPPAALASMFERLRDEYGEAEGIVAHFAAHPRLGDRIEAARAVQFDDPHLPLMSDSDWQSLQEICRR